MPNKLIHIEFRKYQVIYRADNPMVIDAGIIYTHH